MGSPNEMVASYSGPARPFNLRSIPLVDCLIGIELSYVCGGSWGLGLSAGDVLGCTSAVAGDARFANFGVARRARPVEDIGFAGLAVAGHTDKSGFDCAVALGGWSLGSLHVSGKVGQGCWQDTSTFVNVEEVRQGLLGRRLGQLPERAFRIIRT